MTTIERAYSGAEKTQRIYARVAGFLFLWLIITGLAGLLTTSHIVGSRTFAETAKRVMASERLYRVALSSELIETLSTLLLAFALYATLKPVNELLAQMAMYWRLGESFIGGAGMIVDFAKLRLYTSPQSIGILNRPVTGLSGSDGRCGGRHVQHLRDILQYRLHPLLLPVFQIEVYPQDPVGVRRVCLGRRDDHLFWQSDLSRSCSAAPVRLGANGHCRSHNRHLADAVCGKDPSA
jgi:hypothetical protein